MSIIIPYIEELEKSDGAFVKPDGTIWTVDEHLRGARDYCLGYNYDYLTSQRKKRI